MDNESDFTGAVFTGAGVRVPENVTTMNIIMAKILSVLMPKAGVVPLEHEYISRDPQVVDAYIKDPLVYDGKTTARLGTECLSMMKRVEEEASLITLPIFILHGGDDKMVARGAAEMLEANVSSKDKTLKIYDGFYHEVHNDPGFETVLADILEWLESHL